MSPVDAATLDGARRDLLDVAVAVIVHNLNARARKDDHAAAATGALLEETNHLLDVVESFVDEGRAAVVGLS